MLLVMVSAELFSDRSFFTNGVLPNHRHATGQQQTISHIVDACPLTKFDGGLQLLHEAEYDAVKWLESITNIAFAK